MLCKQCWNTNRNIEMYCPNMEFGVWRFEGRSQKVKRHSLTAFFRNVGPIILYFGSTLTFHYFNEQPTGQPTNWLTTNWPTNWPTNQPTGRPTNRPANQLAIQPTGHPTNWPANQLANQPTNQLANQQTDRPKNASSKLF